MDEPDEINDPGDSTNAPAGWTAALKISATSGVPKAVGLLLPPPARDAETRPV
jgi:hypothetical protein